MKTESILLKASFDNGETYHDVQGISVSADNTLAKIKDTKGTQYLVVVKDVLIKADYGFKTNLVNNPEGHVEHQELTFPLENMLDGYLEKKKNRI